MALFDLLREIGRFPAYISVGTWAVVVLGLVIWIAKRPKDGEQPDALPDFPVPYLSNAYKSIFKKEEFLSYVK